MSVTENYRRIVKEVEAACNTANRDPASVTLIAVSKTHLAEAIQELYDLGHRDFGESKLQEAQPKIEHLPNDIRWHMIGHLQSNKAKRAAELFTCIHTLTSTSQLNEIQKSNRRPDVFVEVNIAEEPQKSGLIEKNLDEYCQVVLHSNQVNFLGLMTIGPRVESSELMRPYFRRLRELNDSIGGQKLSMGMSDDFSVAIQEGATHVRVGTAIFGSR